MKMSRYEKAHTLAADIDRLAYLIDPYEYWDVIGGRDEVHINAHISSIAFDLMTDNAGPYVQWLSELFNDTNNSERDRARALDNMSRLLDFISNCGE